MRTWNTAMIPWARSIRSRWLPSRLPNLWWTEVRLCLARRSTWSNTLRLGYHSQASRHREPCRISSNLQLHNNEQCTRLIFILFFFFFLISLSLQSEDRVVETTIVKMAVNHRLSTFKIILPEILLAVCAHTLYYLLFRPY